jgi:maltooligosyltrehalose trehalohydrolase
MSLLLEYFTTKKINMRSLQDKSILLWHRRIGNRQIQCVMNFSDKKQKLPIYAPQKSWVKILDSADRKWKGPGSQLPSKIMNKQQVTICPWSIAIFEQKQPLKKQKASRSRAAVASSGE